MGCVQSSPAAPAPMPTAPVGNRRRLSVLKQGADAPDSGAVVPAEEEQEQSSEKVQALLQLLPEGSKRFSLLGQQSRGKQKGFDNKTQCVAVSNLPKDALNTSSNFGLGYACKKGLKPESPNQDDFFVMQVDNRCGLYGIFDGHGPHGHEISHFAHQLLPTLFLRSALLKTDPKEALRKAFVKTHAQTVKAQERNIFDCSLSGTTGTVVYLNAADECLYVAHVGDSRSIMGMKAVSSNKGCKDLTKDHKPSNKEEKKRIVANGGQVRRLDGDINDRLFEKGKLFPGLAMSRSIGDTVGQSCGVIAEPDVNCFKFTENDEFLLLASDGIWEFITSKAACDFVREKSNEFDGDAMKVSEALAQRAWDLWIENETDVVDDITVILVYLKGSRFYKGGADCSLTTDKAKEVCDTSAGESSKTSGKSGAPLLDNV